MDKQTKEEVLIPATNADGKTAEPVRPPWKSRLVIFLFALLILIPLGVFAYSKTSSKPSPSPTATPSPSPIDETANWKEYKRNGFSFIYPKNWEIRQDKGRTDINNLSTNTNLTLYYYDAELTSINVPITSAEDIKIGSETANFNFYLSTVTKQESGYSDTTKLPLLGKAIKLINFHLSSSADQKDLLTIKQILSTFKFTTSDETASWISYKSASEPNLSFKYPSSWTIEKKIVTPDPNINSNVPQETESVNLFSKKGSEIMFATGGNYIGGGCSGNSQETINQVLPLAQAKGLYFVDLSIPTKSTDFEMMGIVGGSPKVGKINECDFQTVFYSKSNSNKQMVFSLYSEPNPISTSDRQDAMRILQSLKY